MAAVESIHAEEKTSCVRFSWLCIASLLCDLTDTLSGTEMCAID